MIITDITVEHLNELIHKAIVERCEICIEVTPESENITIRPWQPFEYACPYRS